MPEDIYKRIKSLAIERDLTLREIITEALVEKLEREETSLDAQKGVIRSGSVSAKLVRSMEDIISREAAITLLVRKCEKHGCDPIYLTQADIDDEFLRDLCQGMSYLSSYGDKECLKKLKSEMEVE